MVDTPPWMREVAGSIPATLIIFYLECSLGGESRRGQRRTWVRVPSLQYVLVVEWLRRLVVSQEIVGSIPT